MVGPLHEDGEHCSRCIRDADRCASCGFAIFGRYVRVTGVSGKFCGKCADSGHVCAVCRAPMVQGQYRDGRFFCYTCSGTRLDESSAYHEIFREVREIARDRLGITLRDEPSLVVKSGTDATWHDNVPEGVCGLYERSEKGSSISIVSHLTESRATAVLAHELAHAWQAENCPDQQSHRLREGFAEWVAWKVLASWDEYEVERTVIEARTDEYGRGFQHFRALEERHGQDHVMWYARSVRARDDP